MNENDIKKLENLISLIRDGFMTKNDFENAFKVVVDIMGKMNDRVMEMTQMLERTHQSEIEKSHLDHFNSYSDLKSQVNDLFVKNQLDRMSKEQKQIFRIEKNKLTDFIDEKLEKIDEKLAQVKDGYTPMKGLDYFDGENGKDFDSTEIKEELKRLEKKIDSIPRGRGGARKSVYLKPYNLSSLVDGSTKAFTLPVDTLNVIGVFGTQFPITFDSVNDFTFSGKTLTLTDKVGAPQSGQTLWALIEVMFYY